MHRERRHAKHRVVAAESMQHTRHDGDQQRHSQRDPGAATGSPSAAAEAAPHDHRLPRHQQQQTEPQRAMGHCDQPGLTDGSRPEGQHASGERAQHQHQQGDVGTPTRSPHRARPAVRHRLAARHLASVRPRLFVLIGRPLVGHSSELAHAVGVGCYGPRMSQRVPFTGGEKESLHVSLDRHRDVILWKLEGLDEGQVRRPMTPSGTSLLGLVKHLAAVEYGWFCETFGRETEPMPFDEDDETADLRAEPDETTAEIVAFYGRARAAADQVINDVAIEDVGTAWFGDTVSMRWVLIHMIEETARHAGHMDIVRELIDGTTGDHRRD
jgi:hypothetical protein